MQRGKTDFAGTVGLPKAGEEYIPIIMNYKGVFVFAFHVTTTYKMWNYWLYI